MPMPEMIEVVASVEDLTVERASILLARVANGGAMTEGEKLAAIKFAAANGGTPSACPFCASTRLRNSGTHGAVGCDNCGAVGPIPAQPNDVEATALWNTRA